MVFTNTHYSVYVGHRPAVAPRSEHRHVYLKNNIIHHVKLHCSYTILYCSELNHDYSIVDIHPAKLNLADMFAVCSV